MAARRRRRNRRCSTASTPHWPALSPARPGAAAWRRRTGWPAIAREARAARDTFSWTDPSASAPSLARGLAAVRRARAAISRARRRAPAGREGAAVCRRPWSPRSACEVSATAQPAGLSDPTGPFAAFAPPPTLDAVTPGQTVDVRVVVAARGRRSVTVSSASIHGPSSLSVAVERAAGIVNADQPLTARVGVTVPADAAATRPYFARASIGETRYTVRGLAPVRIAGPARHGLRRPSTCRPSRPWSNSTRRARRFQVRVPVVRREAQLPYGYVKRELEVLPAVGLTMTPSVLIVPSDGKPHTIEVQVDAVAFATIGAQRRRAPRGACQAGRRRRRRRRST